MSEVRVKENESLDSALRRFKRQCARSGILAEVRKREHYEKPSVRRKKKAEAARRATPAGIVDDITREVEAELAAEAEAHAEGGEA